MLKNRKEQVDHFKPLVLVCKRLINNLKEWDNCPELIHQLKSETNKLSELITNLLTKQQFKQHLDVLKRLYLAPEQLRKLMIQIENGNESTVSIALQMLQSLLGDIDLLKSEIVEEKPAIPQRTPTREPNTFLNHSPNAKSLFSEIDKALDFTLPDFTAVKTSGSTSSTSTIGESNAKLQQAIIEKPRKVIIKSVRTKPSFNSDTPKGGVQEKPLLHPSKPSNAPTRDDTLGSDNYFERKTSKPEKGLDQPRPVIPSSEPINTIRPNESFYSPERPPVSQSIHASKPNEAFLSPERRTISSRQLPTPPNHFQVFLKYADRTVKRALPKKEIKELNLLVRDTFNIDHFNLFLYDATNCVEYTLEDMKDLEKDNLVVVRESNTINPTDSISNQLTALLAIKEPVLDQSDKLKRIEKSLEELKQSLGDLQPKRVQVLPDTRAACEKHRTELGDLRSSLQQLKEDVMMQLEESRAFIDSQLTVFKSLVPVDQQQVIHPTPKPEIIQSPPETKAIEPKTNNIDIHKEECQELDQKVHDFVTILESTRLDLTRGCRPSSELYEYIIKTKRELEENVQNQKKILMLVKTQRKEEWETTLQQILYEQKTVSESWHQMEEIQNVLSDASQLSESILPILLHQKKHKLPAKQVELQVWDTEQVREFGKDHVLQELKCLGQPGRPEVEAIVETQRRMRVASPNPFEKELQHFTFKNNIGIEAVEAIRHEKDLQIIRELLFNSK